MPEFNIFTLKNGIRVVHKEVTYTKVAHCGFILDIGSRDESEELQGLAHFWEHMAFKGTEKRKSIQIINRLEVLGGELNAYTTKEKICFYASLLGVHYEKAMELLKDITFYSVFPQKELEKEKSVILEEMLMYQDAPEDAIQDHFEGLVFNTHPLGYNILGTPDSVKSFKTDTFKKFIKEHLDTSKIVFSSIGNLPFKKVKELAEKHFYDIPASHSSKKRTPFKKYKPSIVAKEKPITQAHCVIGRNAYSIKDNKRIPFFMLTNILGGPGLNSRLNLSLREKYGLVYNIDANYSPFIDTGLLEIYFGTEKKQLDKAIGLALKELKKLKTVPLSTTQLHNSKEQIMGQLAMAEESNISLMQLMGKSILDLGYIDTIEDIFTLIRKITSKELLSLANELFEEDELTFLKYIPQ